MSRFVISGFSDEISPWIDEQITGIKQLGLSHLVLRFVDRMSIADLSFEKAREVKKKLDDNGIRVSSLGSPIGKVAIDSPFADEMKRFLHVLKLAKIFETSFVRIFSFYIPQECDMKSCSAKVIERLGAMAVVAEEYGVTLIHENEKEIYGDTDTRCNEILEAFAPYGLRAAFDPANFVQCDVEPLPAYNKLKPFISYMHIKDAKFSDHSVVPSGEGDGKVREILYDLAHNGDDSEIFLSLEPHLGVFAGLAKLEKGSQDDSKPKSGLDLYKIALDALNKIIATL
jgi:sugar phosphate isomerase/epimerase